MLPGARRWAARKASSASLLRSGPGERGEGASDGPLLPSDRAEDHRVIGAPVTIRSQRHAPAPRGTAPRKYGRVNRDTQAAVGAPPYRLVGSALRWADAESIGIRFGHLLPSLSADFG